MIHIHRRPGEDYFVTIFGCAIGWISRRSAWIVDFHPGVSGPYSNLAGEYRSILAAVITIRSLYMKLHHRDTPFVTIRFRNDLVLAGTKTASPGCPGDRG